MASANGHVVGGACAAKFPNSFADAEAVPAVGVPMCNTDGLLALGEETAPVHRAPATDNNVTGPCFTVIWMERPVPVSVYAGNGRRDAAWRWPGGPVIVAGSAISS